MDVKSYGVVAYAIMTRRSVSAKAVPPRGPDSRRSGRGFLAKASEGSGGQLGRDWIMAVGAKRISPDMDCNVGRDLASRRERLLILIARLEECFLFDFRRNRANIPGMAPRTKDLSVFAKQLPEVRSIGKMIFDPVWAQKMHAGKTCELMHIISGSVQVVTSRRRINAGPGDTLILPTGMLHRDDFDISRGLEVFMVFFSWKAERRFFSIVDHKLFQALTPAARAEISKLCESMQVDFAGGTAADRLMVRTRLLAILLVILREALRGGSGRAGKETATYGKRHRRQVMLEAREYLEKHYHEAVSLDGIAGALRVSPFYLSHAFSEESDFSLFSYLTSLRMAKSRALLAEGKMNVSEVARAVGIEDSNYFSKVFRRHFGVPPRAVRGRTK